MACPSRRNSGLTAMSYAFPLCSLSARRLSPAAVPAGEVDFSMMTAYLVRFLTMSVTLRSRKERSVLPSGAVGVGTQTKAASASLSAVGRSVVNESLPLASSSLTRPSSLGS